MSRGGRRFGVHHLPIESCHIISAWGSFLYAQMWSDDVDDYLEWEIGDRFANLTTTVEGQTTHQSIRLTFTPCHYGGQRAWFLCPGCHRRRAKLYLPVTMFLRDWKTGQSSRVREFRCRDCYQLTYLQRQDHRDLYWPYCYRADRVAERWLGEMTDDWIGKKKGQHQSTFDRRVDQYERLIGSSNMTFLNGALFRRLSALASEEN